jgi:class 3 adenylate cyclase
MAWLLAHAFAFAAVNAFLIGIWLVSGGSADELRRVWDDPVAGVGDHGFWPAWVIASWGVLLVFHAGTYLSFGLFGRRARRRRRHMARTAMRAHRESHAWVQQQVERWKTGPPPPTDGKPWVAVMFTDVVESTELAERLGDDAWGEMLAAHRQQIRRHVAAHGGQEVGTQGDGFLIRFASPADAVTCAIAIEHDVAVRRAAGENLPEVRIGIHAGKAVADGDDLIGRVINLAYRVTAMAETEEILVTEPVADEVSTNIPLIDRGLQTLKGIAQPRHLLAIDWKAATAAMSTDPASETGVAGS